jgi:hypothetical protein
MPAIAPYRGRANHQFTLVVLILKNRWEKYVVKVKLCIHELRLYDAL